MEYMWKPRFYSEGMEKDILEMLDIVYSPFHNLEYWIWKYKKNPGGFFKDLICVADSDGKVVGQYALIPVRIKVGKELNLASQSVDTATHPDYRRQKMFEKLANMVYDNAAKNGMAITYGFAGEGPSYWGFIKKLGWYHICFLTEMFTIVDNEKVMERKLKSKKYELKRLISLVLSHKRKNKLLPVAGLKVTQIKMFDERLNNFWEKISCEHDIIVARDLKYMQWRLSNPEAKYVIYCAEMNGEIVGYTILRCVINNGKKVGYIADVIASQDRDGVILILVNKALELFEEERVHISICNLPENHRYCELLEELGYKRRETRMSIIARININEKVDEDIVKDVKNWFFTLLDSDHV